MVESQTLQDQVYSYLHDKIVSGNMASGQRIVEQRIAKETGISRSPIREAIRRLSSDGLVSVSPRGGVRVYRPTFSDFQHLYECRLSLEPAGAYYAATRISGPQQTEMDDLLLRMTDAVEKKDMGTLKSLSSQFHYLILEASGNPYLVKVMKQLNALLTFYRNAVLDIPQRIDDGLDEHTAVCRAVQMQDGDKAQQLMRMHIQRDYKLYLSEYDQTPEKSVNTVKNGE